MTTYNTLDEWFLSLPEGRQKVLRENKWMLAGAAYEAGKLTKVPEDQTQLTPEDVQTLHMGLKDAIDFYNESAKHLPHNPMREEMLRRATKYNLLLSFIRCFDAITLNK